MKEINFHYKQDFNMKKRKFRKYVIFAAIFLFLILGYFIFNFGLAYRKISVENDSGWGNIATVFSRNESPRIIIEEQSLSVPLKEDNRLDVLVLGIRGENDPNGGLLTDTIMVMSLDKETGKTAMISIPRDLYVNIKDVFTGKVNDIYWAGLINSNGYEFTKKTFSRISGVYIDNVIVFNFESFKSVIDSVGGIDIILDKPFEEKQQWGYVFYLPAGENHLDGENALYYARSRYSTNDFDRSYRQQKIIMAIKEKVISLGILANPFKINSLVSALGNSVRMDLNISDIGNLVTLGLSFGADDNPPKRVVLSTKNTLYDTSDNDLYILLPQMNDYKPIQKVFKKALENN